MKMKKFEYSVMTFSIGDSITTLLSNMALKGWELVSVDNGNAYFKREQKTLLNKLQDARTK